MLNILSDDDWKRLETPWAEKDQADVMHRYRQLIVWCRHIIKPTEQTLQLQDVCAGLSKGVPTWANPPQRLIRSEGNYIKTVGMIESKCVMAVLASRLREYRAEYGQCPHSMEAVDPIPPDPRGGRSIHYQKEGNDFIIRVMAVSEDGWIERHWLQ